MKPDYVLKLKARDGKHATKVGAAWRTRSGDGLNIKLDPGIAIVGGEGIDITLWPFEERGESRGRSGGGDFGGRASGGSKGGGGAFPADDFGDDEPPFATSAFSAGLRCWDPCRGVVRT